MTASLSPTRAAATHPVDRVPSAGRLVAYGAQHVVAFYAGAVLVPIIIARSIGLSADELRLLIMADLFTCGIASIIQSVGFWKVGVRLPLLQGVTFACVSPVVAIALSKGGGTAGLLYAYGAVIVAGIVTFLIAPYFARLLKFFTPVVTGTVLTLIGISLLPVGARDAVTNPHTGQEDPANARWLLYALGTIAVIVLIQRFFRGFMKTVAVLIGLVGGTAVAFLLGDASFDEVGRADAIGFAHPFVFGMPRFDPIAIISMIVVMLIIAVESTGSVFATGDIVGKRIGKEEIAATVRADGVASIIGGVFNSFPYTCFSENVGLVRLTGVKSRWVVAAAGGIMIVLGLLPKGAAAVAAIPAPVLGGAALTLFATVAVIGIQVLSRVDFSDHRNLIIVATSLGMGLLVTTYPKISEAVPPWLEILFGSGITLGSVTAIALNVLFFHVGRQEGPAVAGGPAVGVITLPEVNRMSRQRFGEVFGSVVQNNDWVLDRAFAEAPFADTGALRAAFAEAILGGSDAEKTDLIRSFPDLGARSSDGEALAADHVALAELGPEERAEVDALAVAYRDQFGFPLVVCAREIAHYDRVLRSGRERLENSAATERAFAVVEVAKIVNYRFDDTVANANPIASALGAGPAIERRW